MKRAFLRQHGKAGLELIEEACVLLRTCPPAILAIYFLGTIPFAAGFLVFWSDLSRHPDAREHLGIATLAMTALFIWMKFFHARFGGSLLAHIRGECPPSLGPGEIVRSVCMQTVVQSTALFVVPIAAIVVLPFGWVYAFYQSISALDDGKIRLRDLVKSAAQQSKLWPGQNHFSLLALSGFGIFVFFNWVVIGIFLPQLLRMFLGIESAATSSPFSMLNTTFFAGAAVLTFLCVDPIFKTCYILRCFYGNSLRSGDDLKTEVQRLSGMVPALAACLLFCLASPALQAAESPPTPEPAVTSGRLDRSIDSVIHQEKYKWREPAKEVEVKSEGLLAGFIKSIVQALDRMSEAMDKFYQGIIDWLRPKNRSPSTSGQNYGWMLPSRGLLILVLAVVACGLAFAAFRTIRARRRSAAMQEAAVVTIPDLENEDTTADELPEDDWTKMGRRFLEQGQLRLALRAFYLASLAHLAASGLITIVRSKSNRDYEREIRRRGHAMPELPVLFSENVGIFDRVWYGVHEVNADLVQRFVGNLEKMKGVA